jgi:hypothetical protein
LKSPLLIFVFLSLPLLLLAQKKDSLSLPVKAPVAEYFFEKEFFPGNFSYHSIDTSLNGVQKYFPNNFSYSLGLSNRKLSFEPSSEIGFSSGLEPLDLFGYNRNETRYYRARTPYTEVFVLFGQKKEQFARVLHTQNITKQWNIALSMLRMRSDGFYQRQTCTDNNISLSSNYTTRNKRYAVLANGIVSSVKTDENGGVLNEADYENNLFVNKKLIPISLADSRTRRGNREAHMTHYLNFGKRDTLRKDTTTHSKIFPKTSLSYSFGIKENWFVYDNKLPQGGFYEHAYFDTLATLDSTQYKELQHGVSLQSVLFKMIRLNLGADLKDLRLKQFNKDSSLALDTSFSDQVIRFEIRNFLRSDTSKGFSCKIGKQYILSGAHQGDDLIYGSLSYQFNKRRNLSLAYSSAFHSVPFIYDFYCSNHFWWRYSFDKIQEDRMKLYYTDPDHKLTSGAEMTRIDNYVYLDSNCLPTAYRGSNFITSYSVFLQKNFQLKHFGFNNQITWQTVQAPMAGLDENAIHVPEFVTNHSLFYKGKWFKGATDVQLGFDLTYYSSYYADAYMPALGLYYWQHEKKSGNYPYVDFFFSMKVQHVRIFFKSEHVNSGLLGPYYLAPHTPAPDRSIKLGINWMFFD